MAIVGARNPFPFPERDLDAISGSERPLDNANRNRVVATHRQKDRMLALFSYHLPAEIEIADRGIAIVEDFRVLIGRSSTFEKGCFLSDLELELHARAGTGGFDMRLLPRAGELRSAELETRKNVGKPYLDGAPGFEAARSGAISKLFVTRLEGATGVSGRSWASPRSSPVEPRWAEIATPQATARPTMATRPPRIWNAALPVRENRKATLRLTTHWTRLCLRRRRKRSQSDP